MKDIIFNPLLNLSNKGRYSGTYLAKPENTSDHIAQVGFYALLIGNEVNVRCRRAGVLFKPLWMSDSDEPELLQVDLSLLALKALVHDVDELSSADIPRTTKYSSDSMRELFHEMETRTVKDVSIKYDFPQLFRVWQTAKSDGIEGYIIKISDLLTVVHKTVEEVNVLGNKNMLKVAVEVLGQVKLENSKLVLDKFYDPIVKSVFTEIYLTSIHVLEQIIEDNSSQSLDHYFKSN